MSYGEHPPAEILDVIRDSLVAQHRKALWLKADTESQPLRDALSERMRLVEGALEWVDQL